MKQAEIAKVVGYVQQYQNSSFAHSVFDYVLMGRASNISLFQKPSEADRELVYEVLGQYRTERSAKYRRV